MTPHASTTALLDELGTPSVQPQHELKEAVRAFRKALHRASGQAAVNQSLIGDASIDEEHEGIRQQYEGLDAAFRAIQNKHDKTAEVITGLLRAHDGCARRHHALNAEVERVSTELGP